MCWHPSLSWFVYLPATSQLFDIARRYDTLLNVIRSLTKNIQSIFLTAMLALILIYMFSIIGYVFFNDDFVMDVQALSGECSVTEGGGGTSDSLVVC